MLILWILAAVAVPLGSTETKKIEAMNRVKMSSKQLERVQQLHYGWYMQAVSAVLGSVGKQMYMQMKRNERRAFVACLDAIEKEHDVRKAANCLVHAIDGTLVSQHPEALTDPKLDFVSEADDTLPTPKAAAKTLKKRKLKSKLIKKTIVKKVRRNLAKLLKRKEKFKRRRRAMRRKLVSNSSGTTAKMDRHRALLKRINKKPAEIWGQTNFFRAKRNVLSLYSNKEAIEEAKRADQMDKPYHVKNMDTMPELKENRRSPVKAFTEMLRRTLDNSTEFNSLQSSYNRLSQLQGKVEDAKREQNFKHRMLDMVVGKTNPLRRPKSFTDRMRDIMPTGAVDESVYGLVDAVSKHTKDSNGNFLSPRFLPLMPDKYNTKRKLLSPDLFPMYKDESPNSIMPLPTMLEKAGLGDGDRNSILELVMDVSGVNRVVDGALHLMGDLKAAGLDTDLFDITKQIDQAFGRVQSSLTKEQKLEMKNQQFAFMSKQQMAELYGEKGVYNTTTADVPFDMNEVDALSPEERKESLRLTIRELAKGNGASKLPTRRKRATTITLLDGLYKIVFLNPTLFSPQSFAPTINTLSVLGPLVISPQLFCPSVLSPLLMSLPVISPQVGNPLIFSPYVVGPNVLSAAVFNAYVFSPYVLSPNVVNPYVLSPLILSPFVLCPDVVSPTILSGVVLSPSVLSPSIFTDSALAINILSPTFLS